MLTWVYRLGRVPVALFFFLFSRLRVIGKSNVPRAGGIIVSANHVNLMDPIVVSLVLRRATAFMAKEELFHSRIGGSFVSIFGAFPVRRGTIDRTALKRAGQLLASGKALIMFPEGARSTSEGHRPEGFLGVAMIASRECVPVLPIGISGTQVIRGWQWLLRRPRITVSIGEPLSFATAEGPVRRQELEKRTLEIMTRIHDLVLAADQEE